MIGLTVKGNDSPDNSDNDMHDRCCGCNGTAYLGVVGQMSPVSGFTSR